MAAIDPIFAPGMINQPLGLAPATGQEQKPESFMDTMKKAITGINDKQKAAEVAMRDLATGRRKTLHETMIAAEEAGITFKLGLAVRSKVIAAYQEVMRMSF